MKKKTLTLPFLNNILNMKKKEKEKNEEITKDSNNDTHFFPLILSFLLLIWFYGLRKFFPDNNVKSIDMT